jgi:hypothetical protein
VRNWSPAPPKDASWAARRALPALVMRSPWCTRLAVELARGAMTARDVEGTAHKQYWGSNSKLSLSHWYSPWADRLDPSRAYPEWTGATRPEGITLYRYVAGVDTWYDVPWSTVCEALLDLVRENPVRWDPIIDGREPIHFLQMLTSAYDCSPWPRVDPAPNPHGLATAAHVLRKGLDGAVPVPSATPVMASVVRNGYNPSLPLADGPIEGDQLLPVEWGEGAGQLSLFCMDHVEAPSRSGRVKR